MTPEVVDQATTPRLHVGGSMQPDVELFEDPVSDLLPQLSALRFTVHFQRID